MTLSEYIEKKEKAIATLETVKYEATEMAIKALEQQPSDCKIFGHKENCFGGATENECNHCDYKIQAPEKPTSDDCVSRQAVIDYLYTNMAWYNENGSIADDSQKLRDITNLVNGIPPVTPTHGTCKDCTNYVVGALDEEICIRGHELIYKDFYCADYKKRGSENEIN